MGDLHLRLPQADTETSGFSHTPLGRLLVDSGKIGASDLEHALKLQKRMDAPLGEILIAEGLIEKKDILAALSWQAGVEQTNLKPAPSAIDLARRLPIALCLRHGAVPWSADAQGLYVATSSPQDFVRLRDELSSTFGQVFPVIVDKAEIQAQQSQLYGRELAQKAALQVADAESCRSLDSTRQRRKLIGLSVLLAVLAAALVTPNWTVTIGILVAVTTLLMTSALKLAAFSSGLTNRSTQYQSAAPFRMPRVSVLVPLLQEREIAGQLVRRLTELTYPKSLLNVVLVLEEGDALTRETIAKTRLPDWMSAVEVPHAGDLTTKPRALNYALNFCQGSIIGVWDAEDWPEADQIEKVVTRFNTAPDNVVCLQGMLDYYNSRTNWLTRCFTVEYSIWWRIIMPGIARLGLVVPLGGTTLFFKRDALEALGGWDAHNVTEDADLGVRLARHGYKTELLGTVTREEATSVAWSWVRQRSRWLKGFLVTYMVHMRAPRQLFRELGFWRFLGLQTLLLASVVQFATAPLMWSFWITLFGVTHPLDHTLGREFTLALAGLFLAAEALNIVMGWVAVSARGRRHLLPFVPTMMVYFILGSVAAYKAIWELVQVPFFWDKTQHGVSHITDAPPVPESEQS